MISPNAIAFNTPIGRVYSVAGGYYSSVTNIIHGFKPDQQPFNNDFMSVGTLGHHECLLQYKPYMEPEEVTFNTMTDEEINSRLDLINLMWNTCKPKRAIDVEFVVYDPTNRYAGRVDILSKIKTKIISIGDIKTGQFYKYYELQLGGYYNASKDAYKINQGDLYILDSNAARNPENKPKVLTYNKDKLEEFAEKFIVKAETYNEKLDSWIEEMK